MRKVLVCLLTLALAGTATAPAITAVYGFAQV